MSRKLLIGLAASLSFPDLVAQTQLSPELLRCQRIAAPLDRLRCYDDLVGGLAKLELQTPTAPIKSSAEFSTTPIPETRSMNVGTISPRETASSSANKQESISPLFSERKTAEKISLRSTVVGFSRDGHGRAIVVLDNNEIWVETTASKFIGDIAVGASVTLTREGLSWYRLRIDDQKGVMAVRRAH